MRDHRGASEGLGTVHHTGAQEPTALTFDNEILGEDRQPLAKSRVDLLGINVLNVFRHLDAGLCQLGRHQVPSADRRHLSCYKH
ncbi:hypothetical protein DLJ53_02920 [Acuticoccus sediminis]|uniref:Uncharacterized protein n=1 Tax=Acuticoccus sediminis TaxID=2184697 RepID=A0A8B2NVS8_9HYPH|nr:hypothetical protein DLJ53_02920 [Acuticoccus sediminis]